MPCTPDRHGAGTSGHVCFEPLDRSGGAVGNRPLGQDGSRDAHLSGAKVNEQHCNVSDIWGLILAGFLFALHWMRDQLHAFSDVATDLVPITAVGLAVLQMAYILHKWSNKGQKAADD